MSLRFLDLPWGIRNDKLFHFIILDTSMMIRIICVIKQIFGDVYSQDYNVWAWFIQLKIKDKGPRRRLMGLGVVLFFLWNYFDLWNQLKDRWIKKWEDVKIQIIFLI